MCPPPALSSNAAAEIKKAPLPSRRRKDGLVRFAKDTTSQGGEDGILEAIFEQMGDGPRTVVDVGAWDGLHTGVGDVIQQEDGSLLMFYFGGGGGGGGEASASGKTFRGLAMQIGRAVLRAAPPRP